MSNHTCEAIVVTCIDFRFQKIIDAWISKSIHGKHDRVSLAGAVLDLPYILKQIAVSVRLHNITRVILVNHEDCGAYGSKGTYKRHVSDLQKAKSAILKKHSHLQVGLYFLHLNGEMEEIL